MCLCVQVVTILFGQCSNVTVKVWNYPSMDYPHVCDVIYIYGLSVNQTPEMAPLLE